MGIGLGQVIAEEESSPGFTVKFWCRFATSHFRPVTYTSPAPGGSKIFRTDVDGVGIRVLIRSKEGNWSQLPHSKYQSGASWAIYKNVIYKVQLIKTGDIRSGTIVGGIVGNGGVDGVDQLSVTLSPVRIEAPVPTCSFTSHNLGFALRNVDIANIERVGYSDWVPANLVSGGCQYVSKVSMTFQGAYGSNDPTLFTATGGSGGVGIELRSANPDAAADPTGTRPIVFAPRGAGGLYKFRARYRRNGLPLKAGAGNASITVKVAYD
ncbi:type 1 fimbria pilin [Luteibacter rhizovicinus]|uniref:Type 1 fimbria pilin n=2 Tax=Luteibacter rhizovicinus TaxID=242606 RepID=A0A4R3YXB7_9GAMM|nr:type 1 fimbria pilin [Luteibacter rhizovicinus]